jgi:hypothetical protein
MSALPPKADIAERNWDVRFVPKADKVRCSKITLLEHLVSPAEQFIWKSEAESLGRLEVWSRLCCLGRSWLLLGVFCRAVKRGLLNDCGRRYTG